MLSMVKGIKVGSGVRVLRGKFFTQKGVVQASERVGRARKWIVKLNGGVLERFSARMLELEQRHLIPPPSTSIKAVSQEEEDSCSSNTFSDENSTSDSDEMCKVEHPVEQAMFQKGKTPSFQYPLRFIIKYISLFMPACILRDAEGPTGAIGTWQQGLMSMMIE